MRRTKRTGNFIFCLLINMLLNIEGLIPAAILVVLHFAFGISWWWTFGAVVAWIVYLMLWMLIFGWASSSSNSLKPVKENKNPYSSGAYKSTVNKNDSDN